MNVAKAIIGIRKVDDSKMKIPEYLEPFLEGTPLSLERLKLAWPDLSFQDKIVILEKALGLKLTGKSERYEVGIFCRTHNQDSLVDLALNDPSPYVRYLASLKVRKPAGNFLNDPSFNEAQYQRELTRSEKVENDPYDLIRISTKINDIYFGRKEVEDAEAFWSLPQIERLLIASSDFLKFETREFSKLFKHATQLLNEKKLSENDVCDVVHQYVGRKALNEALKEVNNGLYDGYSEWSTEKGIEELWHSIPEAHQVISNLLIENLPSFEGMLASDEINSFLVKPPNYQLQRILYRKDVILKEKRRELYLKHKNEGISGLGYAAISNPHYEILDEDISSIIPNDTDTKEVADQKTKERELLSHCGSTLLKNLIHFLILEQYSSSDERYFLKRNIDAINNKITESYSSPKPSCETLEVIFQLRLLRLCQRSTMSMLKSGKEHVVENKSWETYVNLKKIICPDNWTNYLDFLPEVEIGSLIFPSLDADTAKQ